MANYLVIEPQSWNILTNCTDEDKVNFNLNKYELYPLEDYYTEVLNTKGISSFIFVDGELRIKTNTQIISSKAQSIYDYSIGWNKSLKMIDSSSYYYVSTTPEDSITLYHGLKTKRITAYVTTLGSSDSANFTLTILNKDSINLSFKEKGYYCVNLYLLQPSTSTSGLLSVDIPLRSRIMSNLYITESVQAFTYSTDYGFMMRHYKSYSVQGVAKQALIPIGSTFSLSSEDGIQTLENEGTSRCVLTHKQDLSTIDTSNPPVQKFTYFDLKTTSHNYIADEIQVELGKEETSKEVTIELPHVNQAYLPFIYRVSEDKKVVEQIYVQTTLVNPSEFKFTFTESGVYRYLILFDSLQSIAIASGRIIEVQEHLNLNPGEYSVPNTYETTNLYIGVLFPEDGKWSYALVDYEVTEEEFKFNLESVTNMRLIVFRF